MTNRDCWYDWRFLTVSASFHPIFSKSGWCHPGTLEQFQIFKMAAGKRLLLILIVIETTWSDHMSVSGVHQESARWTYNLISTLHSQQEIKWETMSRTKFSWYGICAKATRSLVWKWSLNAYACSETKRLMSMWLATSRELGCTSCRHIQIVSDDTDVIVLLVHFYWKLRQLAAIIMNQFDGKTLNINATAMTFGDKCIQLLPMHAIVVSQVATLCRIRLERAKRPHWRWLWIPMTLKSKYSGSRM